MLRMQARTCLLRAWAVI